MANFNGKILHMIKTNEQASVESLKTNGLDQRAHGPGQRLPLGREGRQVRGEDGGDARSTRVFPPLYPNNICSRKHKC